jgi:uncharacterized protein (DUF1330 family)
MPWFRGAALLVLIFANSLWAGDPVYELRIYSCNPGKRPALEERFRDHTMRIFEKHGMKSLAYWTPLTEPVAETTLIYILEHASRDAAKASWEAFRADPEWKQIAAASEQKHGKILTGPPKSIYMTKTDYSPEVGFPPAGNVFELRTYTAAEGKLDQLNTRFRDHTDRIFNKHGMHAYGYWMPTDAPESENTLIYVLIFPSEEQAKQCWQAFRDDPEWKKALAESQKEGSLTAKRPESVYLRLTDFSPTAKQ